MLTHGQSSENPMNFLHFPSHRLHEVLLGRGSQRRGVAEVDPSDVSDERTVPVADIYPQMVAYDLHES